MNYISKSKKIKRKELLELMLAQAKRIKELEDEIEELTVLGGKSLTGLPSGNKKTDTVSQFIEKKMKLQDKLLNKFGQNRVQSGYQFFDSFLCFVAHIGNAESCSLNFSVATVYYHTRALL